MTRLTMLTILFGALLSLNLVQARSRAYSNYERGPRQAEVDNPPASLLQGSGLARGDYDDSVDVGREEPLGLPSNATAIRANIVDTFTCTGRAYGYYADMDNECQVFHVCLPVTFPDETEKMYKWSFICPQETIFNQESFTCARAEDSVPCQDAAAFYSLNENFGKIPEKEQN